MTGPAFLNATNKTFIIPTQEASPFAFFGSGHMHYFSDESTRPEADFEEDILEETRRKIHHDGVGDEGADVDHPGHGAKNRGKCSQFSVYTCGFMFLLLCYL